jgi:hypothetical protein
MPHHFVGEVEKRGNERSEKRVANLQPIGTQEPKNIARKRGCYTLMVQQYTIIVNHYMSGVL